MAGFSCQQRALVLPSSTRPDPTGRDATRPPLRPPGLLVAGSNSWEGDQTESYAEMLAFAALLEENADYAARCVGKGFRVCVFVGGGGGLRPMCM